MKRFESSVAWVTGGGGGIGRSAALRLASEGAAVGISTIDAGEAATVAAECEAHGVRALGIPTDMADPAQVRDAHQRIAEQLGPVDVLVNNVGVNQPATLFLDTSDEVFERILTVNFMSAVRATRLVLPSMIERRTGSVVNVASAQGLMGWPMASAYASSKGAMMAWTRQVANEIGEHGVRINSIVPGATMTAMNQAVMDDAEDPEGQRASAIALHILPRMGEPDEVAAAIAFAASSDAAFMTGSTLVIDGGCLVKGH